MEELSVRRKKRSARIAVFMCLLLISLMVVVTSRHHLWVMFAAIGVELMALVFMLRESRR